VTTAVSAIKAIAPTTDRFVVISLPFRVVVHDDARRRIGDLG